MNIDDDDDAKRQFARDLDKFYTKPEIAQALLTLFRHFIVRDAVIVEPSAGGGAFLADDVVGFDIAPEHPAIGKLDFINDWLPPDHNGMSVGETETEIAMIGNPPFGRSNELALEFIRRSFMYAKTVGFILPIAFRKWRTQSEAWKDAKLIVDIDLPARSFTHVGGPYKHETCFQIWTTFPTSRPCLRLKAKPPTSHPDFAVAQDNGVQDVPRGASFDWDFAVLRTRSGDFKKIHTSFETLKPKSRYMYFKAHDPKTLTTLLKLDFERLARQSAPVLNFGKADVVQAYIAATT